MSYTTDRILRLQELAGGDPHLLRQLQRGEAEHARLLRRARKRKNLADAARYAVRMTWKD